MPPEINSLRGIVLPPRPPTKLAAILIEQRVMRALEQAVLLMKTRPDLGITPRQIYDKFSGYCEPHKIKRKFWQEKVLLGRGNVRKTGPTKTSHGRGGPREMIPPKIFEFYRQVWSEAIERGETIYVAKLYHKFKKRFGSIYRRHRTKSGFINAVYNLMLRFNRESREKNGPQAKVSARQEIKPLLIPRKTRGGFQERPDFAIRKRIRLRKRGIKP